MESEIICGGCGIFCDWNRLIKQPCRFEVEKLRDGGAIVK